MPKERTSFLIYPNMKPIVGVGDSGQIDGRQGLSKWDYGNPLTKDGCVVEFKTYDEAEDAAIALGLDPHLHIEQTRIIVLPEPIQLDEDTSRL